MRIKRKSGLEPKSQDITSMVMEGLFSEDILVANGNQEFDFRFFDKNSEEKDAEKHKYQCKAMFMKIRKNSMSY